MKNLLVAIDFSRNAIHALEYALVYAAQFSADVSMIWVDNVSGPDLVMDVHEGSARHESRDLFKGILKKYEKKGKKQEIFIWQIIMVDLTYTKSTLFCSK